MGWSHRRQWDLRCGSLFPFKHINTPLDSVTVLTCSLLGLRSVQTGPLLRAEVVWSWRKTPAGLSLWPSSYDTHTFHSAGEDGYTLTRWQGFFPSLLGPALPWSTGLRKAGLVGVEVSGITWAPEQAAIRKERNLPREQKEAWTQKKHVGGTRRKFLTQRSLINGFAQIFPYA